VVVQYLKHPDLSYDLAAICKRRKIPEIATRKKINNYWTYSPPVCCALSRYDNLGEYGRLFGMPEYVVQIKDNKISDISVVRGAPCGASRDAANKLIGMPLEKAVVTIGIETQYLCSADPADWDPLYGKSPVHLAADIHAKALSNAIKKALH